MANKHFGNVAPYNPTDGAVCTWCTGQNAGILQSDSYNSCVGMVLYSPDHLIGVVSHFSGSMGTPQNRPRAATDVLEILRGVCPISPGFWNAWVFGGISLRDHVLSDAAKDQTKPLMDTIRATLSTNPYMGINTLLMLRMKFPANYLTKPNPFTQAEMRPNTYIGHKGVRLNLASGVVTFVDDEPKKIFAAKYKEV